MGHRQCAAGLHLRDGVLKLLQNLWLSSTRTQPKAGDRPSLSREAGESQALKWRESWKILEVGHVPLGILEDIGGIPESSFSPLIPISAGKPAAASTALGPRPKGLVSFQEKVCEPSGTVGTFKRKKWMEHDGNLCAKHLGAYLIFPSWSRYLFQLLAPKIGIHMALRCMCGNFPAMLVVE